MDTFQSFYYPRERHSTEKRKTTESADKMSQKILYEKTTNQNKATISYQDNFRPLLFYPLAKADGSSHAQKIHLIQCENSENSMSVAIKRVVTGIHYKIRCKMVFSQKEKCFYAEKRYGTAKMLRKLCNWKGEVFRQAKAYPDHIHIIDWTTAEDKIYEFFEKKKLFFDLWTISNITSEAENFNAKDITLGKNMKKITKYILPVETALNRRTLGLSEMFRK